MLSVMGLLLDGMPQPAAYCADMNRSTKLPFCLWGAKIVPCDLTCDIWSA
jgi:hypothetical protein